MIVKFASLFSRDAVDDVLVPVSDSRTFELGSSPGYSTRRLGPFRSESRMVLADFRSGRDVRVGVLRNPLECSFPSGHVRPPEA